MMLWNRLFASFASATIGLMDEMSTRFGGRCLAVLRLFAMGLGLLLAGSAPGTARAQVARATVSVDSVRIGERFTVSLVVSHRFMSTVTFPPDTAGPAVFGDVQVLGRSAVASRYGGTDDPGVRIDSVAYEVTTFALDTARVPALPVRMATGGDTMTVTTSALQIPIRSTVPPDAPGLRGLAPLAVFPGPRWPWLLLGLVAIILVAGLVYYWRQRTRPMPERAPPSPPAPARPPYAIARQRLDALEHETDWADPAALEAFFVDVSAVVRRYVDERLAVGALECTTRELIQALRARSPLPAPAIEAVDRVLTQADLVKFADERPTGREARSALQTARTALDAMERALPSTTPSPSAPADSASAGETLA